MPSSINSLSPTFRDLLLNRNIVTDTISNNGLTTLLNGIGTPVNPSTQPEIIQPSEDIEVIGVFHRESDTIVNKYQGSLSDYEQYSVNYLPGNNNTTIAGNPWNNGIYDVNGSAAELLQANNDFIQVNTSNNAYLDTSQQTVSDIYTNPVNSQTGSYNDSEAELIDESNGFLETNVVKNMYSDEDSQIPTIVSYNSSTPKNGPYSPGDTNSTIGGSLAESTSNILGSSSEYLQTNTSNNIYLDVDKQTQVNIEYKSVTFQTGSYLDENNNVNVGGPDTQPFDIASSLLNGGGVGFDPNGGGLVSNADVRSSLSGRILTASGVINDTRLGQLSAGYLATAIGNNIAFELQENTIGKVNTNLTSLIKGGNLIIPNYKITVGSGILGKTGDLLERMTGAKIPLSLLKTSIFASESGWDTGNISRANSMLENTGKGQILQMFSNLNASTDPSLIGDKRNGFTPPLKNDKTGIGVNKEDSPSGSSYIYEDQLADGTNIINNGPAQLIGGFNDEFEGDVLASTSFGFGNLSSSQFGEFGRKQGVFSWGDTNNNYEALSGVSSTDGGEGISFALKTENPGESSANNFKNVNSLLYKTQELFKEGRMKTLVSGQGVKNETTTQLQISRKGLISKGSGVLSADALLGGNLEPHEVFCRTWSTFDRYDNNLDLQKSSGLIGGENGEFPNRPFGRASLDASVLDSTGFVNIGPTTDDEGNISDIKRFMFSIENLAWADDLQKLMPSEKGPGDPLSGLRGRIMWFPPYDISFNESTSVNWDRSNFIGRGEPLYTYNNTERTGSLSWKIIIDHPNYSNYFPKDWGNDEITSFYAGCLEYEPIREVILTPEENDEVEIDQNIEVEEKVDEQEPEAVLFNMYFPNDVGLINDKYENGLSGTTTADTINYSVNPTGEGFGIGVYKSGPQSNGAYSNRKYTDKTNFGLNGSNNKFKIGDKEINGYQDDIFISTLSEYMKNECKYCKIFLKGYASKQGQNSTKNQKLSDNRANEIKDFLKKEVLIGDTLGDSRFELVKGLGQISSSSCIANGATYTKACKKDRYTEIKIEYDPSLKPKEEAVEEKKPEVKKTKTVSIPKGRFFTETHYFKKLKESDEFIYRDIRDKIKYFHPSFHSMTPEGFNSRLNFLHQCTRQGPTTNGVGNPNNLAFGRPPICILRIGDFYHTKIAIDSMTLDYEPLVWDLNPEGVGVQPMIANVTISFAFIGGSSLEGPINKLQNAISYNFYANTEIYDARADRITINKDLQANDEGKGYGELVPGESPNSPVVKLKNNEDKEGLNDIDKDQEAVADNEANKPEVAEEPEKSEDYKHLKDIVLVNFFNDDDKIISFKASDLDFLSDGWNYRFGVNNGTSNIALKNGPIKQEDLTDNGSLIVNTGVKTFDMIKSNNGITLYGKTFKDYYDNNEIDQSLTCYSANTSELKVDGALLYVEFYKNGEDKVFKSKFDTGYTYFYQCDFDDEIRGHIADGKYSVEQNLLGCLMC
tara:strand:+ start:185 stop:4636 length:4452 start_codon:yes stop_codon:yes gene_type:complete